jgi:hypothetical protein
MPEVDFIRADIEHRRRQVQRLRGEIRQLQRSGISSASAEVLLDRMLVKIDQPCAERDRWFEDEQNPTPFPEALETVRHLAPREGWRYQHVQAIIVSIDQYAEAATGLVSF